MSDSAADKAEIRKTEEALSVLETELQTHYCQIGKSILELADTERRNIEGLVDEIIETRRHLAVLNRETQCQKCLTYNSADSSFCKRCGARLITED